MNRHEAQSIAILALSFLTRDPDRLERFMGWTGLAVDDLAQARYLARFRALSKAIARK